MPCFSVVHFNEISRPLQKQHIKAPLRNNCFETRWLLGIIVIF